MCRYKLVPPKDALVGISNLLLDENRQIVVDGNYTLAILRLFLKPSLVQIAIPVIYNICTDFGESDAMRCL